MHGIGKTVAWIAFTGTAALAQTTQGLISGRVLDLRSGQPVAGAAIQCQSYIGGPGTLAQSGTDGYFVLPLLSPGLYRIRIEASGYQAQEVHQVDLSVAGRLEYRFQLRLLDDVWEAGEYHSIFLRDSSAILTFFGPDVDTSHSVILQDLSTGKGALESSISQVVDVVEVEDLPLAGRDVYTALILQPGVAAGTADARGLGLAVSGQRPTSSNFLLDGVENNNYLVSGPLMMVAPEAVQEYRISTNNFSAEYGGTVGVLANAVTREGGNRWHGIAYFYMENAALNGNDFQRNLIGLPRAPLHQAQPGFQAGGPILKNRLFTSTSFEYLRSRSYGDPVSVLLPANGFLTFLANSQYLPSAAYATQLLQQHPYPVPQTSAITAPAELSIPDFANQWLALERLDYALPGDKHRVTARVIYNHLDRPDFLWSPYQGFDAPLTQNTFGAMAALISTLSPNITQEARAGWTSDHIGWNRPDPNVPTLTSGDGAILPGSGALYSYLSRDRTTELSDELVWLHGSHLLQFGGGFLLRGASGFLTAGRDGNYYFDTVLQFAQGEPSQFETILDRAALPNYQLPNYNRDYSYNQFDLFAQDTFRLTARLSINYGLRCENFGAPSNTGNAKDELFVPGAGIGLTQRIASGMLSTPVAGDEQIYGSDNRGWAPRLGASYDVTGKARTLLRGAYGIFYDRPFDNLWQNVRLNGSVLQMFNISANYTNFLAPFLPQLPSFQPQLINLDFPYITWVDPSLKNAYAQSFFLGLHHEITHKLTLEVNGTGELGRKLITTDILNRGEVDNPELPQILYRANQGSSDYSALTVLARYRSSRAQLQAAYTWSHSIDNQSSPLAGDFFDLNIVRLTSATGYEAPAAFTIEGDSSGDRGNSDFDQRQNLVLSAIVNLPQPRGNSLFEWLLHNWRLATLDSFRSGFPYTVYSSACGTQIVNCRADLVSQAANERSAILGGEMLLNAAAFANPFTGTNGNLGRNSLTGPGLINIDVSLNRSVPLKWLGEAGRLNLRADAFNFLNHANLNNPYPVLGASNFGQATYGREAQPTGFPGLLPLNETARQIQLMLRVEW